MKGPLSQLSKSSRAVVKSLISEGWVFEDRSSTYAQTGESFTEVAFKSPEMEDFGLISECYWKGVTKEYLIARAAGHVAHEWARNVFHYTSVITNPLAEALREHFIKSNSTSFQPLYSTDAEFDIKVKTKNNKPKQVKVTIEIL